MATSAMSTSAMSTGGHSCRCRAALAGLALALATLPAPAAEPAQAERAVRAGVERAVRAGVERALRAGEYRHAEAQARELVKSAPSAQAWHLLARALVATGAREAAKDALRSALAFAGTPPPAVRMDFAQLRRYGKEHAQAVDELSDLLESYRPVPTDLDSVSLAALARAAQVLAQRQPELFHEAVNLYRQAMERDPDNLAARVALGDLLLRKNNNRDALRIYREALERDKRYAPALLGLARSQHFDHLPDALDSVRESLALQPTLVPAHVFLARMLMEQQQFDAAGSALAAALAVNPGSLAARSMRIALHYLRDQEEAMRTELKALRAAFPHFSDAESLLADVAARNRRYGDALDFAQAATARNPRDWRALARVGFNRLRLGQMRDGRQSLERAFRGDPFDVRVKNTLDLLDKLEKYDVQRSPHFELIAEGARAGLLAPRLLPVAEDAYAYYAARYRHTIKTPIRIELYTNHADFSVRTVGLTGLDILGASFGPVILIDSPRPAEMGAFNWASALWHEIAHSFHLDMSRHRAPRWFSEGLAVHEEHRARPGWGGDVSPGFLRAQAEGKLRSASELEAAFLQPRFANEIPFTYFLASLLVAYIEQAHGADSLVDLLHAFATGDNSMRAVSERLGYSPQAWDEALDRYVKTRFGDALVALADPAGPQQVARPYDVVLSAGKAALASDDLVLAETLLRDAQALFPEHAGPGSSYHDLAEIYRRQHEPARAIAQLARNIQIDADDLGAHLKLAKLYDDVGDPVGSRDILERAMLIQPFNPRTRERLAALAEAAGDFDLAVRERRAVIALDDTDPVGASYRLAAALRGNGEMLAARKELLRALENAPLFEDGLELLLQLRATVAPHDKAAQTLSPTRNQSQ